MLEASNTLFSNCYIDSIYYEKVKEYVTALNTINLPNLIQTGSMMCYNAPIGKTQNLLERGGKWTIHRGKQRKLFISVDMAGSTQGPYEHDVKIQNLESLASLPLETRFGINSQLHYNSRVTLGIQIINKGTAEEKIIKTCVSATFKILREKPTHCQEIRADIKQIEARAVKKVKSILTDPNLTKHMPVTLAPKAAIDVINTKLASSESGFELWSDLST